MHISSQYIETLAVSLGGGGGAGGGEDAYMSHLEIPFSTVWYVTPSSRDFTPCSGDLF